jgi:lysophospholipid acyltransferase
LQSLGRKIRANVRPFVLPPDYQLLDEAQKQAVERTPTKRIYDLLSIIAVQVTLNFAIIPFIMLDLAPSMEAWKRLHYYGLFLTFLPLLAFKLGLQEKLKSVQRVRAKKAGVTEEAVKGLRKESKKHDEHGVNFAPDTVTATEKEIQRHLQ